MKVRTYSEIVTVVSLFVGMSVGMVGYTLVPIELQGLALLGFGNLLVLGSLFVLVYITRHPEPSKK